MDINLVPSLFTAQMGPIDVASIPEAMQSATPGMSALMLISLLAGFLFFSIVLTRIWVGIVNVSLIDVEPIASIERRHPYLPSFRTAIAAVLSTVLLVFISSMTLGTISPFSGENGTQLATIMLGSIALACGILLYFWRGAKEYVFGGFVGTVVAFILIGFSERLLAESTSQDPVLMALGVISIILVWRFLFGPWMPHIKAAILGTFIFWIGFHMLGRETSPERFAHFMAIVVALIPAVVWCLLFLKYHAERLTVVLLMFFSGMLSTAPILFYDALVRHRIELNFFLVRIVPESFTRTSTVFVSGSMPSSELAQQTLVSTLIAFLIVGFIEEGSKFWVLKKNGKPFFHSINDVIEMGIIAAIGFAFAENVINPTYFVSFVQQYIVTATNPDWGSFFGNVIGRAILTNMVHILSTGIFAYFYGLVIFAGPYLEDAKRNGRSGLVTFIAHSFLRLPEKLMFRRQAFWTGLTTAVVLHGLFNFIVSLPDLLPGNPRTFGDLFNLANTNPIAGLSIILVPSLFYVVGGFWVLSWLFFQKENRKERGELIVADTYVIPDA